MKRIPVIVEARLLKKGAAVVLSEIREIVRAKFVGPYSVIAKPASQSQSIDTRG